MTSQEILDDFYTRLHEAKAGCDSADLLRWTGEELARAGERLASAKTGDAALTERGAELLVISKPHTDALAAAGMHGDALATHAMSMLTVLMSRVNPEEFPRLYLHSLLGLGWYATAYQNSLEGDAVIQASQILAQSFGLFTATAHDFIPRFGVADSNLQMMHSRLSRKAREIGEEMTHFRGNRIVPTMAADILADILARLKSLGTEI